MALGHLENNVSTRECVNIAHGGEAHMKQEHTIRSAGGALGLEGVAFRDGIGGGAGGGGIDPGAGGTPEVVGVGGGTKEGGTTGCEGKETVPQVPPIIGGGIGADEAALGLAINLLISSRSLDNSVSNFLIFSGASGTAVVSAGAGLTGAGTFWSLDAVLLSESRTRNLYELCCFLTGVLLFCRDPTIPLSLRRFLLL